jgi:hypothetical protein
MRKQFRCTSRRRDADNKHGVPPCDEIARVLGYAVPGRSLRSAPVAGKEVIVRKVCAILPLAGVVVLGMVLAVEAGGRGAVKADLEVADFWTDERGVVHMTPVGPRAGLVIFRPNGNGKMSVRVQVRDGEPDTAFVCYVVPPSRWAPNGDRKTLTLDRKGKGTVYLEVEIPDPVYWIKVVVLTTDYTIGYCTERIHDFEE